MEWRLSCVARSIIESNLLSGAGGSELLRISRPVIENRQRVVEERNLVSFCAEEKESTKPRADIVRPEFQIMFR